MNRATFTLSYNNKNITNDIAPFVTSFTYIDKTEKEADELEIALEDSQQHWQNEWYPQKGATLTAQIIVDGLILNCGVFTLDEIGLSGTKDGGDTITLKGISTSGTTALRTKQSYRHENKTLANIAGTIAAAHGLTVVGMVPAITIGGATQNRETDLGFLERIGHDYGLLFSVKGSQLVFTNIFDLEKRAAIALFDKSDLTEYSFTDKGFLTYAQAHVSFHNPLTKSVVASTSVNNLPASSNVHADTLVIKSKAENTQQAGLKADVALYRANTLQQGGNISYPGNVLMIAGNSVTLQGVGMLSGKYHITQSSHTLNKDGGYVGNAEIKRLGLIAAEKQKETATTATPVATSVTD